MAARLRKKNSMIRSLIVLAALVLGGCGSSGVPAGSDGSLRDVVEASDVASVGETADDVTGGDADGVPPARIRRVQVLDFGGVPVAGAPVLRHDGRAALQEQVATDDGGWATIGWRAGDVVTAPIYWSEPAVFNWVSVVGFEALDELVLGKPAVVRNPLGQSVIRVANLEGAERVAVHTGCDATTLWAERPEALFRWYDTCVGGETALVIATTFLSGTPEVVLRTAVATVKVGEDLTLDTWELPTEVGFTLPDALDGVEEVAVEVKDQGLGVRRFFAQKGATGFPAALVGRWQLQFWGYQGGSEVFVMKNLAPGRFFEVRADELLPIRAATVAQERGHVRLTFPADEAVDLRATVLVMGDPCEAVGYTHNVLTDGHARDVRVPLLTDADPAPVLSARAELVVRYPLLDPALALLTLGANARYHSPDLSLLQARAGQSTTEVLSATYTMHGQLSCH